MHIYVDDEDAYDNDDNNDDNHDTVTTAATSTRVTTVAVNGFADAVDDKLLEWLSSCNAAQDDTIHKVSIFVGTIYYLPLLIYSKLVAIYFCYTFQ